MDLRVLLWTSTSFSEASPRFSNSRTAAWLGIRARYRNSLRVTGVRPGSVLFPRADDDSGELALAEKAFFGERA